MLDNIEWRSRDQGFLLGGTAGCAAELYECFFVVFSVYFALYGADDQWADQNEGDK